MSAAAAAAAARAPVLPAASSPFARVVDPLAPCPDFPPTEWASVGQALFPFPLDSFQQHAVCAIARGENVLVTAKTGSGKTAVGEYQIAHSLAHGGRVFYTTPIKSLSNQKFAELRAKFKGVSVGILTGDIKFAPDAQVIVMTQEILRNRLFKIGTSTQTTGVSADLSLDGLASVVFDEAHYMFDAERGHAWEETLMLLPPEVACVLLTATLASPVALLDWLGDVRRSPTTLLSTAYRVVPLFHGVLDARGEVVITADEKTGFNDRNYRDWLKGRSAAAKEASALQRAVTAAGTPDARASLVAESKAAHGGTKPKARSFTFELNAAVRNLEAKELLPALFFVLSRKDCERYANAVDVSLLDSSASAAVKHIINFHLHRHKEILDPLAQYHNLYDLLLKGIAFHHSGVLPILKEMVEILFSRGFVKCLFATETFAVGLNMPTKTAVFLDVRKYDDAVEGMRVLRPDEYTQMAGRAGRRGKDTRGLALYLPAHPPLEPAEMKVMCTGSLAPAQSKLLLHYDFILRVLQTGRVSFDLLLGRSFWARQQDDTLRALERDLAAIELRRKDIDLPPATRAECEKRTAIEEVLKTAINAARKEPQRELERWKNTHVGPKWDAAWKGYAEDAKLAAEQRYVMAQHRYISLPVSQTRLTPVVAVLRRLGFIKPAEEAALSAASGGGNDGGGGADADDALAGLTSKDLTLKGVLATEVNEGNAILLPELFLSGILRDSPGEDVVAALGLFLTDKEADDKSPSIESCHFAPPVIAAYKLLEAAAQRAAAAEDAVGVLSPTPKYWLLRTMWSDIGFRWMQGASVGELAEAYSIYEGNLLRGLLKLSNLLTEWLSLAGYCEHLDVLDRLRDAPTQLLRDIAQTESLYLREGTG